MKKRIIATVLSFCVAIGVCFLPSSEIFAQNNDDKYANYNNMSGNTTGHAKYIVPNLYRQDASYINVKTFPLVVNGSVEYFPLDIFALYPYLQVVYSKLTDGFYINNTKNNHYIAFDMETGTTTTHDSQLQNIQARIFNRTYYVPAAKVCEILGMNFETYDDQINGIRAARISDDRAKMTLSQLVTAYSPVKKEQPNKEDDNQEHSDEKNQVSDQGSQSENQIGPSFTDGNETPEKNEEGGTPGQKEEEQKPEDPFEKTAKRHIAITFNVSDGSSTAGILDVLQVYGIKAIFLVDSDDILSYPDTLRRMIAEGHTVGLELKAFAEDGTAFDRNALVLQLDDANDSLHLVTKTKTRIVAVDKNSARAISVAELSGTLKNAGYGVLEHDILAYDGARYYANQLENLKTALLGKDPLRKQSFVIKFGTYGGTDEFLSALVRFTDKYPAFIIRDADEYTGSLVS